MYSASISYREPSFYADELFISVQRAMGVALIVAGVASIALAFLSFGIAGIVSFSCLWVGSALIGATFIQQVVGNAEGCQKNQGWRITAGVILIVTGVFGWGLAARAINMANETWRQ